MKYEQYSVKSFWKIDNFFVVVTCDLGLQFLQQIVSIVCPGFCNKSVHYVIGKIFQLLKVCTNLIFIRIPIICILPFFSESRYGMLTLSYTRRTFPLHIFCCRMTQCRRGTKDRCSSNLSSRRVLLQSLHCRNLCPSLLQHRSVCHGLPIFGYIQSESEPSIQKDSLSKFFFPFGECGTCFIFNFWSPFKIWNLFFKIFICWPP